MRKDLVWVTTQLMLMVALLFAPGWLPLSALAPFRGVGLTLAWLGMILAGWASLYSRAGKSFTPMPSPRDNAILQTTGPYRRVRHPVYSSLLLWAFGVALAGGTASHLLLAAAHLLFFNAKAAYEERALTRKFSGYPE
jgi:protein-S-isoprenylcysteine O-methyltransferase Ste14